MVPGALRTACAFRLLAVHTINRLLLAMSEFGDNLPASTVIYAVVAIVATVYTAR
jgi:hypothetical protein